VNVLLSGLVVYKIVQFIKATAPVSIPPWVELLLSVLISIGVTFVTVDGNVVFMGLVVATLAEATQMIMRLAAFAGDLLLRKSIK
jgi:hypothetical protein